MNAFASFIQRFNIRTAIIAVLIVSISIIALYIFSILASYNNVLSQQEERYEQILIAKEIEKIKTNIILAAMDSIIDKDEGDIEPERLTFILDQFKAFHAIKHDFVDACDTQMEREKAQAVVTALEKLEPIITQELLRMIRERADESGFIQMDDNIDAAAGNVDDDIRAIIDSIHEEVEEAKEASAAYSEGVKIEVAVAAVLLLLLGLGVFLTIIRLLMTNPLKTAVNGIVEANSQVIEASNQIASSSMELSEGASHQAGSIEKINGIMDHSYELNVQNAKRTDTASDLAKSANDSAEKGNQQIQELVRSMQNISDSSGKIAKIIKTIDEIAFQTNLLSLNAAVEAARAGEHGLGFAVVAEEVKSLAGRSADAAKETELIILQSIEQVENGNRIANDTDAAFSEILEKIRQTADNIEEIDSASKEQISQFELLTSALKEIESVAQQNASTSEEAAATAEELNAQSNAMFETVADVGRMVGMHIETGSAASEATKYLPGRS